MGQCCSKQKEKKQTEKKETETETEKTEKTEKTEEKEEEKEKEKEEEDEKNDNLPHVFEDIIDIKHVKYMGTYDDPNKTLFWGIGIENESYLQWSERRDHASFCKLKPIRERYSVNYYKSFRSKPLDNVMRQMKEKTMKHLTYPIYVNSHTLQKTDSAFRHQTLYDHHSTPNPEFTGSIHDILLKECLFYKDVYDDSVVFDGDTIEFITQNYYKTTVQTAIDELVTLKQTWLREVAPYLEGWVNANAKGLSLGVLGYPTCNDGIVSFMTTQQENMGICNTQTLHLNITLPTWLENGCIMDKPEFVKQHLAFISMIQVVEPLLAGVYGTPDLFSVVDPAYSIGSQRGTRSRYISLQTFDVQRPVNGKLLTRKRPEDPTHWYNRLANSPYELHTDIGYDINFNKFKNHGVEIRLLDWFPEIYLKDLMDFFLLLAQHAVTVGFSPMKKGNYNNIILCCLQKGCRGMLSSDEVQTVLHDLFLAKEQEQEQEQEPAVKAMTPYQLLCMISCELYQLYRGSEMIELMSPEMKEPMLTNYNEIVFQQFHQQVYGKPLIIIRAETSPFEQRVTLVPSDIGVLLPTYDIMVESSATRCFIDRAYEDAGATIIPSGSWTQYPRAIIVGLKGIRKGEVPYPGQTLFHFAHCFKEQEGWEEILQPLRGSRMIDYEFMLDDAGKRTLSFCYQAGYVGAYLTLMSYYATTVIESEVSFSSFQLHPPTMDKFLKGSIPFQPRPRILLVGCGTVGLACKQVLDSFGLSYTVKRSSDPICPKEILQYDILLHAIRLTDRVVLPFLTEKDIDSRDRRLRLITDLSCDLGHAMNPLPIYSQYGTKEKPVQRLRTASQWLPPLDLIAVPYLPSFNPVDASTEFSSAFVWYLTESNLLYHHSPQDTNEMIRAMNRSYDTFLRVCA